MIWCAEAKEFKGLPQVETDNMIIEGRHISDCGFSRKELDSIGLSSLKITYHLKMNIS